MPLECVTPHEARFANALELGVRFGKTIVLGEADSIAPMLVPLLRRDLSRQGPRFVVQVGGRQGHRLQRALQALTLTLALTPSQVGDKAIDYNERFKP